MCELQAECHCHTRYGVGHWVYLTENGVRRAVAADDEALLKYCPAARPMTMEELSRYAILPPASYSRTNARFMGLDFGFVKNDGKLPPMNCKRCNECNEYVGKEHLNSAGEYFCRACKENPYR